MIVRDVKGVSCMKKTTNDQKFRKLNLWENSTSVTLADGLLKSRLAQIAGNVTPLHS